MEMVSKGTDSAARRVSAGHRAPITPGLPPWASRWSHRHPVRRSPTPPAFLRPIVRLRFPDSPGRRTQLHGPAGPTGQPPRRLRISRGTGIVSAVDRAGCVVPQASLRCDPKSTTAPEVPDSLILERRIRRPRHPLLSGSGGCRGGCRRCRLGYRCPAFMRLVSCRGSSGDAI